MLHIALVSRTSEDQRNTLKERFDCELHDFSEDRDGLAGAGDIIEVVYGNVRPFELPEMKKLKWVQATWAGIDNLLYPEMRESGTIVTNVRGQCATSMSEHAIAGLLYFGREFHRHVVGCQNSERTRIQSQFQLSGSTVCVLGAGGIGATLIPKLTALGVNVIGVNSTGTPTPECSDVCTLDEIKGRLSEVDHIVCTLPATQHTHEFIDKSFLMALKTGACIVNISRGALVNEADLVECIESGHICGAVLDVSNPEPPEQDSPLWNNPKVLFTSHTSYGPSSETGRSGFDVFCTNLEYYIEGNRDKMVNVANFELGY